MPWAAAEFTLSEEHHRLVWRATASRLPGRRIARALSVCLVGLGVGAVPWLPWLSVGLVALGAAMALQQWWDWRQYLQRCRQAMGFGGPVEVRFDDDGVHIIGARSHVVAAWDAPMEDRGPLLVIKVGTHAVHVPWASVEPINARAEVVARMGPPFSADSIRVVDSALDERTMTLLKHASTATQDGLTTLLFAVLSDPRLVARLYAAGVDVAALDAAATPAADPPVDAWSSPHEPAEPADLDAMHRVLGLASRRASPPRLEELLLELMQAPELAALWRRAGRAEPLPDAPLEPPPSGPGLVFVDDDQTPWSYVVAELERLGLSPLEATRTAMIVQDEGRAKIVVHDPELRATEARERAAAAGWPLVVEVVR